MLLDHKITVVLPAAGIGLRSGFEIPKQYIVIANKPLYQHTINTFLQIAWIDEIILVVAENYLSRISNELKSVLSAAQSALVKVVVGAEFRHQSIFNGVKAVYSGPEDIVVVHDVVRVFVGMDLLRNIVTQAIQYGACGVFLPQVSTILTSTTNGFLAGALNRLRCCSSEMPQAFRLHVIDTAYRLSTSDAMRHGTECLQLVIDCYGGCEPLTNQTTKSPIRYARNVRVKLVRGHANLWKVTYAADVEVLRSQLEGRRLFEIHHFTIYVFTVNCG